MQFFYTINGWAGQNAFLDGAIRGFYVAAIPLLATILAALLVFRPRRLVADDAKIARIAVATISAVLICALLPALINWFSLAVLNAPVLSSRPYVTHWVNALVVEPNDNSFPCSETIMIGALSVAIWAVAPALAWPSFLYALLFCLARVFCGSNYVEDVLVGWLAGFAIGTFALSIWSVPLRRVRRFPWFRVLDTFFAIPRQQMFFSLFLLLTSTISFWVFGIYLSPSHYNAKIAAFEKERTNALLSGTAARNLNENTKNENAKIAERKTTTSDAPREGEGASSASSSESLIMTTAKEIPRPGKTNLGGNLPIQARQLLSALQNAQLAHSLVSVDVASLHGDLHRDNINEEHFAFVRFQVRGSGSAERKRVVQTAARIVRIAFAQNPKMQNVDVVGVVLNDPERDGTKYPVFSEGMIPVFTASVERSKLDSRTTLDILNANATATATRPNVARPIKNVPLLDDGSWLRTLSRLYFNERLLPAKPLSSPTSVLSTQTLPTATPLATPKIARPTPVSPIPTPTPTPIPMLPLATPKMTPPIIKPKSTPSPSPSRSVSRSQSSTRMRSSARPRRAYRSRFPRRRTSHRRLRRSD